MAGAEMALGIGQFYLVQDAELVILVVRQAAAVNERPLVVAIFAFSPAVK
jgi:hypothetical protein